MTKDELASRVIVLQSEITHAILQGHKAHDEDEFKSHRIELMVLRCMLYGEDSKICKTEKDNCRNCKK
jgi:hypothetical protein